MHETYREELAHGSLRFLIIVFKDEKNYLLKIFLHKIAVHQFPIDTHKTDKSMPGELPPIAIEKYLNIAREWVRANY